MGPERHHRGRRLFEAALSVSPSDRREFVARECAGDTDLLAEVERLLAQETPSPERLGWSDLAAAVTASTVGDGAGSGQQPAGAAPGARVGRIPERLGRYRIIRMIGEGGMGAVYEAEQESPRRIVALKVIRPGYMTPSMLRRFDLESQVLGRLQHPGIAQIHEAGMVDDSDGRGGVTPFFAMEFVRGKTLVEYVKEKILNTRQRLELMAKVCDGVYHAHQKGVIHRDLKPGNILVDESGQPKILDFGVARATDQDVQQATIETTAGALVGTVPYMSPEQVSGDPSDLDTRSDVYTLGVITYEVLAGRKPHEFTGKALHECLRMIREEEPARLSAIDRSLKGDVETIVAKALEKDKARRYASAEALAGDIRRYLRDEPITARPASAWYQASKFATRHRLAVGAAGVIVLALVGATGVSVAFAASESRQRKVAEANEHRAGVERDKAQRMSGFLSDTLKGAGPYVALGRDATVLKEMMDGAARRIESGELSAAPEAELSLRLTIGDVYRDISQYESAERMLGSTIDRARALAPPGQETPEMAKSLNYWGVYLQETGRGAEAETLFDRSLGMSERLMPGDHAEVATVMSNLAYSRFNLGHWADAEPLFRRALEMRRRLFQGDDPDLAKSLDHMGEVCTALGRASDSADYYQQAYDMRRRLYRGGDHPLIARSLELIAGVLRNQGRLAESEPMYEQSLEMFRRLYSGDHAYVADAMNGLGRVRLALGRAREAEPLFVQALEMDRRLYTGDHYNTAEYLVDLADARQTLGRPAEAEPLLREALEMRRRLFAGDHPQVAGSLRQLAFACQALGRAGEAEPLLQQALEMYERLFAGNHPEVARSLDNLAYVRQALGRSAEAEALYVRALEMYRRMYTGDHPSIAQSLNGLGYVRDTQGRASEAEPLYREALEMRRRLFSGDHPDVAWSLSNLGRISFALKNTDEAQQLFREALEMRRRLFPGDHPDVAIGLNNLATALKVGGRPEEGEPLLAEALEMNRRLFKGDHPEVAKSMANLAAIRSLLGQHVEAVTMAREAEAMGLRLLKPEHPLCKALANNVAVVEGAAEKAGVQVPPVAPDGSGGGL